MIAGLWLCLDFELWLLHIDVPLQLRDKPQNFLLGGKSAFVLL